MADKQAIAITSEQAFEILHLPENQTTFFSGSYTKRDGSPRPFNGRRGVTKHLRGGELKYDPSTRGNVTYWDRNAYVEGVDEGYRTIRTDDLLTLRIGKQDYIIVNPPEVEFHRVKEIGTEERKASE